ncbi:MAG: ABC transporter substrate-binding protein [Actinomycetota bacterium]
MTASLHIHRAARQAMSTVAVVCLITAACSTTTEPESTDATTAAEDSDTSAPTSDEDEREPQDAQVEAGPPSSDDEDAAETPEAEIEVVDGAGTALVFDAPVERIACRNSGCSVTLAQLGLVPVASTFEPARAELYWGTGAQSILLMPDGAENYAPLAPDLIVVGAGDPLIRDLEVIAPVYVIAALGNLADDATKLTRDLAAMAGAVEQGETIVDDWNDFAATLSDREVPGAADVRLLQLWAGDPSGFSGWTNNSQWCDLLRDLALVGECLFDPITPETDFGQFSTEAVLAAQPSHISVQLEWQHIGENVALEERADEAWLQLDAVQRGNAYRVPTSGNFTPSFFELRYELENYLFHVFGVGAGFEDPGFFVDWAAARR